MRAEGGVPRIVLVESDPALRAALARAITAVGFEVETRDRVDAEGAIVEGLRAPLFVVDLDAPGVEAWLARPAARARSVLLATDGAAAARVERRHGAEIDVLIKPFPVERLEARLIGRHRRRAALHDGPLDPILQTRDPRVARVCAQAERLALQGGPICLVGELGTGRRALARTIHAASPRAGEPCAALDATDLLASPGEGVERALEKRLALVGGGTLVVVEPAEWPVRAQVALQSRLRAADEDAGPRCITLAREPLEAAMRAGRVAAELAYRLAGPVLALPPLRERVADQLDYCTALARQLAQSLGRPTPHIDRAFVEALAQQGFPGNRLGVEHRLRRLLIESDGPARTLASGVRDEGGALPSMPVQGEPDDEGVLDLRALERGAIVRALERMQGNRTHASRALGISVRTLRNKIREYGLR